MEEQDRDIACTLRMCAILHKFTDGSACDFSLWPCVLHYLCMYVCMYAYTNDLV